LEKKFRLIKIISVISILSFFFVQSVLAHKVSTYAYREGDKIKGECYFVDGSPCKKSKVEVYNSRGEKVIETYTDDKGLYLFETPEKGELKIVIMAGESHRAEYKISALKDREKDKEKKELSKNSENTKVTFNKDELRLIVSEAVEKEMAGLREEISLLHKKMDKISLRDIIGGLGYIIGVWAIIMLIKKRKNAS